MKTSVLHFMKTERDAIMQNKGKQQVEIVHKPIIRGSWHGKDARKIAFKRFLSVIATTAIYLFGSILLGMDVLWGRYLMGITLVVGVTYYQYIHGLNQGENDSAYGEIIYARRESGKTVPAEECERSFHPMKGIFAALAGSAPFVLLALVFAFMAEPVYYTISVLPSWTEGLMTQTEFAAGMAHYAVNETMEAVDIMRIIVRSMVMPFVNIASGYNVSEMLLVERLSPILVLISPLGYGIGYMGGQRLRDQVNTGIKVGDERKKKREMKARKKRQRQQRPAKGPERLV